MTIIIDAIDEIPVSDIQISLRENLLIDQQLSEAFAWYEELRSCALLLVSGCPLL